MEDRIINKKWTKNRSTYLLVGFTLTLFFVFSAFEWGIPLRTAPEEVPTWVPPADMNQIVRTSQRIIMPKPPIEKLQKDVKIDIPPKIVTETITYETSDLVDSYDEGEDFAGEEFIEESKDEGKIAIKKKEVEESIYIHVARMPVFGDCRDIDDTKVREACSTKALLKYIYDNIQYPSVAKYNGIEGKVYAEMVIGKTGELDSYKIVRSPNQTLSNEVLKMLENMPPWQAGMNNFEAVNVRITIPVVFELN